MFFSLRASPIVRTSIGGMEPPLAMPAPADVAEERQRVALGESTLSVRAGERITERQFAYETVIESKTPLPVELRQRLVDVSPDEDTLRYVYGY